MPYKHYLRTVLLVGLSSGILLLFSWSTPLSRQPVAYAHAFVIGSDPIDGSTVASAPRVVRIFFDAAISPASIAHVYTPDEQIADAARSSVSATNPRELDTPLKSPDQLPEGSYTVRWTALADGDGHTTHGVIGFNIGRSSTGLSGQTILGPSTSNCLPQLISSGNANCAPSYNLFGFLSIAWEWLALMALTFWVGILLTQEVLLHSVQRIATPFTATRKQARPLQWLCLTTLLVGELIMLILRTAQFSQATAGGGLDMSILLAILTRTSYGYLWLLRLALVLMALALLWWNDRPRNTLNMRSRVRSGSRFRQMRQRVAQEASTTDTAKAEEASAEQPAALPRYTLAWLTLAALILLTYALTSHAALLAQPHFSAIVLDWLYLTARAVWFGSVAYMGYVLLPLLPVVEAERQAEVFMPLLRCFQPLVLATTGVLLVSGLFLAESSLSTPAQLLSDPYGRTLLVYSLLIALMLALTGYAFFVLRPTLARQTALFPVVDAEMPGRRARQSALEQTSHRLKQSLRFQAWLAAAILLCAAVMAFFAPPIVFPNINYAQSSAAPATNPTGTQAQTKQVGNLSVTLQVLPGRANYANTVVVMLNETATGNAISDASVQMSINMEIMDMGTAHATIKGGAPVYTATFPKDATLSMSGVWDIQLTIQRPHQPALQAVFSVTVTR